jgi:hypothetical protein
MTINVEPPLEIVHQAGMSLIRLTNGTIQAQIGDAATAGYAWVEVETGGDGAWTVKDDGRTSGDPDEDGNVPNPAYERSGASVPSGTIVTIKPGYSGDYWFDHSAGSSNPPYAWFSQPPGTALCGKQCWGWQDAERDVCGGYTISGDLTMGAQPTIAVVQNNSMGTQPFVWSVQFLPQPANYGTWALAIDGDCGSSMQFDVSASDMATAVGNGVTVTFTSGVWTVTAGDNAVHALTVCGQAIEPPAQNYAFEDSFNPIPYYPSGFPAILRPLGGGDGGVDISCTPPVGEYQAAECVITVNEFTVAGSFTVTLDDGSPSSAIRWNSSSADFQTALGTDNPTVTGDDGGPWTLTWTDFDDHSAAVNDDGMYGNLCYSFSAPAPPLKVVDPFYAVTCADGQVSGTVADTFVVDPDATGAA